MQKSCESSLSHVQYTGKLVLNYKKKNGYIVNATAFRLDRS
jgi:hypothetical protein